MKISLNTTKLQFNFWYFSAHWKYSYPQCTVLSLNCNFAKNIPDYEYVGKWMFNLLTILLEQINVFASQSYWPILKIFENSTDQKAGEINCNPIPI